MELGTLNRELLMVVSICRPSLPSNSWLWICGSGHNWPDCRRFRNLHVPCRQSGWSRWNHLYARLQK